MSAITLVCILSSPSQYTADHHLLSKTPQERLSSFGGLSETFGQEIVKPAGLVSDRSHLYNIHSLFCTLLIPPSKSCVPISALFFQVIFYLTAYFLSNQCKTLHYFWPAIQTIMRLKCHFRVGLRVRPSCIKHSTIRSCHITEIEPKEYLYGIWTLLWRECKRHSSLKNHSIFHINQKL